MMGPLLRTHFNQKLKYMIWSHLKDFVNYFAVTEFHPMLLSGLVIVIMLAHKYLQNVAVPGSWEYYVALAIGLVAQTSFLLVTVKYQAFLQQPADYIIDMILGGDSPPQEVVVPPSEEVKPLPRKAPKRLPAPVKDAGSIPAVIAVFFVAVILFHGHNS